MPTGQTKDAGWQIGVSRTVDHRIEHVWSVLTSQAGLSIWLGTGVHLDGVRGQEFETGSGVAGQVRSFRPHDRIRLTWRPEAWDHETTVQVAVQAKGERTLLRFHQERLAGASERAAQRAHWKRVASDLTDLLESQKPEGDE